MYDPLAVQPLRDELTRAGFSELRTPRDVDAALSEKGTLLVAVNSVCGCAAGQARPGLALAAKHPKAPKLLTVFAGVDVEATARARAHFTGYPPSSPSIAILHDGRLVFMLERREIQQMDAPRVAAALQDAFESIAAGVEARPASSALGLPAH
jgi:putative YphP/YqiW family bacilliredoxin